MSLAVIFTIGLPMADMPTPTLRGGVTATAHSGALGLPDNSIIAMAAGVPEQIFFTGVEEHMVSAVPQDSLSHLMAISHKNL